MPNPVRIAAAAATALCIFVIDTATMLHSAVAVLYVLVLVIADDGAGRAVVLRLAVICLLLSVLSFWINHGMIFEAEPTLRLLISLAAIVTTAVLIRRKQGVEAAARGNDLRYRTIFDTLAVAIWEHDFREVKREIDAARAAGVTDLRGYLLDHPEFVIRMRRAVRITDANEAALRLLQVPSKAHFFSHLSDFLPEQEDSFFDCILALDERRGVFETETQVRTMQGNAIDVIVVLAFPPDQGLDRICGSILDMTERHRVQAALDTLRGELDQAVRAATVGELSASIAHEVGQPLTAVRSYTEAARRWLKKTPPDLGEAVRAMSEAATAAVHAGEVIDRVRRLIKATPEKLPVQLEDIVRTAVELSQRQLAGTDVDLVIPEQETRVAGDRILLQQLLINLFSNAVQAMDHGATAERQLRIAVRVDDAKATIAVCDSGPGFGSDVIERAFDPFFTTRADGLGLGLRMCRSIVDAHDGTIALGESNELGGACVEIALPLA